MIQQKQGGFNGLHHLTQRNLYAYISSRQRAGSTKTHKNIQQNWCQLSRLHHVINRDGVESGSGESVLDQE